VSGGKRPPNQRRVKRLAESRLRIGNAGGRGTSPVSGEAAFGLGRFEGRGALFPGSRLYADMPLTVATSRPALRVWPVQSRNRIKGTCRIDNVRYCSVRGTSTSRGALPLPIPASNQQASEETHQRPNGQDRAPDLEATLPALRISQAEGRLP
jgi:hypothetical protein